MTIARSDSAPTDETAAANAAEPAGSSATSAGEAPRSVLPVVEETLRVDKRAVTQGGVRITKRVDTREELVDELLRDQRVEIERRPIGRPLDSNELPAARHEGDTLIVPVVEEVLVTEKRLVLVEEVRITRIDGTHRHPQRVTLRKEEISIERLDAANPPAAEPLQPPFAEG